MLPPWVIVETKASAEELAERQLLQAGYRAYLPRYRRLLLPHGRNRRPVIIMRPLFTRLVFCQDWRGWPPDISITGAIGLMKSRPGIAKLADADIELIQQRERAGEFDMAVPGGSSGARQDIKVGDEVEIEGQKIMGVLAELTPSGKAVIWSLVFDRIVRVQVPNANTLNKVYGHM
jgi:hypothetical protein